jgi:hypothetical protein
MHTVGEFLENKLNVFNVGIIHSLVFFNQKLYMSIIITGYKQCRNSGN